MIVRICGNLIGMKTTKKNKIQDNQIVGNVGLYYVCYQLSRRGWNVLPTSRNAKGIDIIAYNQKATKTITIQVKTLSSKNPVPLGNGLDNLIADFIVICRNIITGYPECFILTPKEVNQLVHRGEKDNRVSYWLQPKNYDNDNFCEKWERIGLGK